MALGLLVVGALASGFWFFRQVDGEGRSGSPAGPRSGGGGEMVSLQWRRAEPSRPSPSESGGEGTPLKTPPTPSSPEVEGQLALLDPAKAGWESEVASQTVSERLGTILQLATGDDASAVEARDYLTAKASSEALLPAAMEEVFDDGLIRVRRSWGPVKPGDAFITIGPDRLIASLSAFMQATPDGRNATNRRVEHKLTGIDLVPEGCITSVFIQLFQEVEEKSLRQVNAVWKLHWHGRENLKLAKIEVVSYEEATLNQASTLLADRTESVFEGVDSYRRQFHRDNSHWALRVGVLEASSFLGHHGLAIADVNGDGRDDLYVCDTGGLPNRLYLQGADGRLSDWSAPSQTDWLEYSPAALFVDFDNDGDQDLALATVQMLLFMENDGTGRFELRGAHEGPPQARSLAAADHDNDGDVDLYVCSYAQPDKATGFSGGGIVSTTPLPYNDAENGSPNMLLENRGHFDFVDATEISGLNANNTRFSFAASFEDFDEDGDADLYVANDFGRNNLYLNEGGRFRDIAGEAGVEDRASGMSVAWGDADGDGRMDLYVGNMFSSAGNRIAFQRRFQEGRSAERVASLQRMARGNTLFLARKDGRFDDASESAGVTLGKWAWSSPFGDLNNDGRLDLLVANGFLTNRLADDL